MWESQVLLTDGQVVFLRVLRFSPTFVERSARYKWNILERAVKPKSKKKTFLLFALNRFWCLNVLLSLISAKTQCPDDLSHAVLDLSCNRTRGEYCTYTCDEGWESMSDERTLYCGLDFSWNMSSSALCKSKY